MSSKYKDTPHLKVTDIDANSKEPKPDPEDILSSSLQTLYSYQPIIFSEAGSLFTYTTPANVNGESSTTQTVTLLTPDTHAQNWSLHVSSIWVPSIYLADHISELGIVDFLRRKQNIMEDDLSAAFPVRRFEVLELGAGAGLPGILIAKCLSELTSNTNATGILSSSSLSLPSWRVTLSDYPDSKLIDTLNQNVRRNVRSDNKSLESLKCDCVQVKPYAWGDDPSSLLSDRHSEEVTLGYDLILAADTLWNPSLHTSFYTSLCLLLQRSPHARVHLLAGLHTGPYTIEGFLNLIASDKNCELCIESIEEREVNGPERREWIADRNDRDEVEKRRWVVWIILKRKTN